MQRMKSRKTLASAFFAGGRPSSEGAKGGVIIIKFPGKKKLTRVLLQLQIFLDMTIERSIMPGIVM